MKSNELFDRITRSIAVAIERGAEAYEMPWHRWCQEPSQPVNAISQRPYRGINTLILWEAAESAGYSSGHWGTYRQWAERGGNVRKGEKCTAIIFWKKSAVGSTVGDSEEQVHNGRFRITSRVYGVFNLNQVENVDLSPAPTADNKDRLAIAEAFILATGASIKHGGDVACYHPIFDEIWLPHFGQFRDADSYYSVLAHECVHWSGAKHRLNRDLSGRFGSECYAAEELIAEIGSAFIAGHLGTHLEPRPSHASYISSWLRILGDDSRAILTASAKAQEAADYLVGLSIANSDVASSNLRARA